MLFYFIHHNDIIILSGSKHNFFYIIICSAFVQSNRKCLKISTNMIEAISGSYFYDAKSRLCSCLQYFFPLFLILKQFGIY